MSGRSRRRREIEKDLLTAIGIVLVALFVGRVIVLSVMR